MGSIPPVGELVRRQKVAIYIRVSTHWQIDKDSLAVQRRELTAYSEMVLGIRDYVVFEDPGYSAKNTDRPDYQRMMDRVRAGEFSHILVWKIDRISRNLLDFASMYDELKQAGIVFVSKNEQFDTSSAIGEAMLKIILVFAELERNMTSERVSAVMLSRANNGQWNGGRVPFGYRYNKADKTFELDEAENRVYNIIVNMYEATLSTLQVSRGVNDKGYRTRLGKEWAPTTIHKILTNPFYTGAYLYNVHSDGKGIHRKDESEWILVKDHHVPSIDLERFDRIQFLLARNKRGGNFKGETKTQTHTHIFAGLLRCGRCGSNMSATQDKRRADGWRPSVYGCSQRRRNSHVCSNKYVSDASIAPFLMSYIANIIRAKNSFGKSTTIEALEKKLLHDPALRDVKSVEGIEPLLELFRSGVTGLEYRPQSVFSSDVETGENERQLLEQRRRKYETALNRLMSLYLYGDDEIPEKEYIIERKRITDDLEKVNARLAEISKKENFAAMDDGDFIEKASYFIMVEQLLGDRPVDYEKYFRTTDPKVPAAFFKNIIEAIDILDGRVAAITFKNGMKHTFLY